jgi:sterol desaturase/sphingolipid hydroxylase (fatty acid hydroxylase superfamily)
VRDAAASLSGGIGLLVIDLAWKVVALAVMRKIYEHRIADLGALGWAALIVADDFCYYWYHRVGHEIRFFWAGHVAHHSSERYYLATALRQSWTAPMLGLAFWLPLPLLGFAPVNVLMMKSFSLLYQYWIHTETIGKLGPIEWIMNTPSHHRVHHGSNPEYIDKNYAGIFIVWDRLFGTFEPERAKVVYGLTTNIGTYNPVRIQLDEFGAIARDARRARTWRGRWHAVFGRTGTHGKGPETAGEAPASRGAGAVHALD